MKLLEFNADIMSAIPTEYASQIKPFAELIRRDSSRKTQTNQPKKQAVKELALVYLFADLNSPYRQYDEKKRWEKLAIDVMDDATWNPDRLILQAIDKYNEMYRSPLFHLLTAAEEAIYKLTDYYRNLEMTETDQNGKYIHSAKSIIDSLSNLGKVAKDLKNLKEMVLSEQETGPRTKGGFIPNEFNE